MTLFLNLLYFHSFNYQIVSKNTMVCTSSTPYSFLSAIHLRYTCITGCLFASGPWCQTEAIENVIRITSVFSYLYCKETNTLHLYSMRGGVKTLKHNVRATLQLSYHGCKYLTHTSKTPYVKRTQMVVTDRFTIRVPSLPRWNKQGIKICDWFLAYYCGVKLLEYKFETSQKEESRDQSADSSKAYRKPSRAFNFHYSLVSYFFRLVRIECN